MDSDPQYINELELQYNQQSKSKSQSAIQSRLQTCKTAMEQINPLLHKLVRGPYCQSEPSKDYNQISYKLRYFWQSQFKQISCSECPLSVFLQSLPDKIKFDELDRNRLYTAILLLNQVTGLKTSSQNCFKFVTSIQGRQSPFMQWCANQYKQNFCDTLKELQ